MLANSVGYMGKGDGEQGNRKGEGSQVVGAKTKSQDNSGKSAYFSSRSFGRSRKYKRGGGEEVVKPKMVKKAKIELPSTRAPLGPCITDGLLASSPRSVKRGDFLDQLWTVQYKVPYFDLGDQPYEISLESGSPRALLLIPCPT